MTITRKWDADTTYRMSSIFCSVEVHHAIDTGEGGAATLTAMRIELFLGENITTCLPY
jgi:hypothetical protein